MSFEQNGGFQPKPLVDVSAMGLTCADCGAAIDKLPFQPSADRPVYCKDCNRKRKSNFGSR
jgi:CxxC-x17-CxxC domain-containing protein